MSLVTCPRSWLYSTFLSNYFSKKPKVKFVKFLVTQIKQDVKGKDVDIRISIQKYLNGMNF